MVLLKRNVSERTPAKVVNDVRSWVLIFVGIYSCIGIVFGGLVYRMDEISPYWQVLGHSSNGFWAYLSSYAFVLSEVDLCAEGKEALHECVSGEFVLSQLGVSER